MEPKIFLTDYASYNAGTQFKYGHWVDLSEFSDAGELMDYITEHFEKAGIEDPEIMITDYEGFPEAFYSESMNQDDFENLFTFMQKVKESYYDYEVIEAFADLGNYDISEVDEFFEALEDSYQGRYDSDEDFAQSFAEEVGLINEKASWPYTCIDWKYAARELMYDYYESNGYYFRSI